VHCRYAYGYGILAKMAMKIYLATASATPRNCMNSIWTSTSTRSIATCAAGRSSSHEHAYARPRTIRIRNTTIAMTRRA
jgi:hypothetical protein